ncbi:hypothetical protein M9458_034931, partial [Cirrhinus mrigala]
PVLTGGTRGPSAATRRAVIRFSPVRPAWHEMHETWSKTSSGSFPTWSTTRPMEPSSTTSTHRSPCPPPLLHYHPGI